MLLPTLGADVFSVTASATIVATTKQPPLFELKWENCHAECVVRVGKFVIQQGSTARTVDVNSLGANARKLRSTLRANGVLVPVDGDPQLLRFAQEYAFDSPSAAAAVVSGTGLNGRMAWKVRGQNIT